MGNDYHEKDYDDEVYEDDYYEKHYDEEELEDDSEVLEEDRPHLAVDDNEEDEDEEEEDELEEEEEAVGDLEWQDPGEKKVTVSYACDECDYRWDDIVIRKKDEIEEEELDIICPMCGSMNVTLI